MKIGLIPGDTQAPTTMSIYAKIARNAAALYPPASTTTIVNSSRLRSGTAGDANTAMDAYYSGGSYNGYLLFNVEITTTHFKSRDGAIDFDAFVDDVLAARPPHELAKILAEQPPQAIAALLCKRTLELELDGVKMPMMIGAESPYGGAVDSNHPSVQGKFVLNGRMKVFQYMRVPIPNIHHIFINKGIVSVVVYGLNESTYRSTSTLRIVAEQLQPTQRMNFEVVLPYPRKGRKITLWELFMLFFVPDIDTAVALIWPRDMVLPAAERDTLVLATRLMLQQQQWVSARDRTQLFMDLKVVEAAITEDLDGGGPEEESKERESIKNRSQSVTAEILPQNGTLPTRTTFGAKLLSIAHAAADGIRVFLGFRAPDTLGDPGRERLDGLPSDMGNIMRHVLQTNTIRNARKNFRCSSEQGSELSAAKSVQSRNLTSTVFRTFTRGDTSITNVGTRTPLVQLAGSVGDTHTVHRDVPRGRASKASRQKHPRAGGHVDVADTTDGATLALTGRLPLGSIIRMGRRMQDLMLWVSTWVGPDMLLEGLLHPQFMPPLQNPRRRYLETDTCPQVPVALARAGLGHGFLYVNHAIKGRLLAPPRQVLDRLRYAKSRGGFPYDVSIHPHPRGVGVVCDYGTIITPVIPLHRYAELVDRFTGEEEGGAASYTDLIISGCIEFVSALDIEAWGYRVADLPHHLKDGPNVGYTHLQVSAYIYYNSMTVGRIPCFNMDTACRSTFSATMIRHCSTSHPWPMMSPNISTCLLREEVPLFTTITDLGIAPLYGGFNALVCVMPLQDCEDDAWVVSRDAANRGLGATVTKIRITVVSSKTMYVVNPLTVGPSHHLEAKKVGDYRALDEQGVITVGSTVIPGHTVLVGRVMRSLSNPGGYVDCSVLHTKSVEIDDIWHVQSVTEEEVSSARCRKHTIVLSRVQYLEQGSKISSLHAQKALTAKIMDTHKMPYDLETGVRPDLIMNVLSMPGRMTCGNAMEGIVAASTAGSTVKWDLSAYSPLDFGVVLDGFLEGGYKDPKSGAVFLVDPEQTAVHGGTAKALTSIVPMHLIILSNHNPRRTFHVRRQMGAMSASNTVSEKRAHGGGHRISNLGNDAIVQHNASHVSQDAVARAHLDVYPVCGSCHVLCKNPPLDRIDKYLRDNMRNGPPSKEAAETILRMIDAALTCDACGSKDIRTTMTSPVSVRIRDIMIGVGVEIKFVPSRDPAPRPVRNIIYQALQRIRRNTYWYRVLKKYFSPAEDGSLIPVS